MKRSPRLLLQPLLLGSTIAGCERADPRHVYAEIQHAHPRGPLGGRRRMARRARLQHPGRPKASCVTALYGKQFLPADTRRRREASASTRTPSATPPACPPCCAIPVTTHYVFMRPQEHEMETARCSSGGRRPDGSRVSSRCASGRSYDGNADLIPRAGHSQPLRARHGARQPSFSAWAITAAPSLRRHRFRQSSRSMQSECSTARAALEHACSSSSAAVRQERRTLPVSCRSSSDRAAAPLARLLLRLMAKAKYLNRRVPSAHFVQSRNPSRFITARSQPRNTPTPRRSSLPSPGVARALLPVPRHASPAHRSSPTTRIVRDTVGSACDTALSHKGRSPRNHGQTRRSLAHKRKCAVFVYNSLSVAAHVRCLSSTSSRTLTTSGSSRTCSRRPAAAVPLQFRPPDSMTVGSMPRLCAYVDLPACGYTRLSSSRMAIRRPNLRPTPTASTVSQTGFGISSLQSRAT